MRPPDPAAGPLERTTRPRWSEVLRALREARGVTLDGWGARLGVSRTTVQRWERGERAPDPGAETAILAYCREQALFRSYDRGPLAGLALTAELLQELLAEARWRVGGGPADAVAPAAPSDAVASARQDGVPPPLATMPPSNLPAPLTSFIGRERELADVRRVQAGTRLITLTGPGGCGKTRLALALAGELLWAYPHGVCFVNLAPLTDPSLTPQVVASTLSIGTTAQQSLTEVLIDVLKARHLLLVLDNCEHLLPACAHLVETLLRACSHLEVVATSRESLGIGGETVWRVPPMSAPGPDSLSPRSLPGSGLRTQDPALEQADTVRLFVERARLQRPEFALTPGDAAAVTEICRRLDGMPLAIELAAARVAVLSVRQIAERLHDRFQLLTGGGRMALPRHQTLRAAIDWSHDLLTAPERLVLRALSVFAGGFALEAAEAVCGAAGSAPDHDVLDLLGRLVDKSLVIAEEHAGTVRYSILETVRQYAEAKLSDAGETIAVRERHHAWYMTLADAAEAAMYGPHEVEWLTRLEQEHDNLRAALGWSLTRDEPEAALRLAGALPRFWELRGHVSEGRQWLSRLLAMDGAASAAARAKALRAAGILAYAQGDFTAAHVLFEQSLALCRELGHGPAIADLQGNLGRTALRQGDHLAARALLHTSLALYADLCHKPGIANVQFTLGVIALRQGDYAAAGARFEASLALNRELGNKEGIANALEELATVFDEQGEDGQQEALLEESLALYRELGDRSGIAAVLGHLGMEAWARREHERALTLLQEGLVLYRDVGDRRGIARLLGNQSLVAHDRRDYERAAALCRESLTLYQEAGDIWAISRYLPVLAGAAFGQGQPERAARLFGAAAALRERLGTPLAPIIRAAHNRVVGAVRAALDERTFAAAWAEGETMSMEAAIDQ